MASRTRLRKVNLIANRVYAFFRESQIQNLYGSVAIDKNNLWEITHSGPLLVPKRAGAGQADDAESPGHRGSSPG
jgi:hypothetical protein